MTTFFFALGAFFGIVLGCFVGSGVLIIIGEWWEGKKARMHQTSEMHLEWKWPKEKLKVEQLPKKVKVRAVRWSKKHDCCKRCGTTKKKHNARGYCRACYWHLFDKRNSRKR